MGTTAQKIQYLDGTKTLLKDTINLTGAGITNDTFRSYASKLKQGYLDILNNGIDTLYNNFPKVSGIGSNLSLTPTYKAPIKLNEIQGDTLQNGTPTPSSPVPIQSVTGLQNVTISNSDNTESNTYEVNLGENLFDIDATTSISGGTKTNNVITSSSYSSGTWKGMDVNFSSIPINQEFTISMDLRLTSGSTGTFSKFNDGVNNFTEITKPTISQNWQRYSYKYTPSSGYSISKIFIQMSAIDGQFECKNIQIKKGSTSTPYSPYFTPYELNKIGNYQDSIKKSTGKNLFDYKYDNVKNVTRSTKSEETNGFKITSTGVSGFGYASLEIDNSLLGKTVTISMTSSGNKTPSGRLFNVNTSGNVTTAVSNFWTTNNSFTITLPSTLESGVKCIALCLYISQTNNSSGDYAIFKNIQIEQNSQATSYEPYGKVWYIQKNIGKVVLNGSESDSTYNTGTTGSFTRFGYLPFMSTDVCKIQSNYVSNYFKYLGTIGGDTTEAGISNTSVSGLNRLFIFLPTSTASTIAQFKTWLTTHNTEILYQLATPIYEVITNTELIEQLESLNNAKSEDGTTNINVTSEDLSMLLNVNVIKGDA